MSNYLERFNDPFDSSGRDLTSRRSQVPARVRRKVEENVAKVYGRGLESAARTRVVGMVTDEALTVHDRLLDLEDMYDSRAPHRAGAHRAIVDAARSALARIVFDIGRE